ncbi:hypothetical protein JOB18_027463 [Solea senegalensis]|uniref:Uncharacterized protein n=1 Tax=Solea senegalensis TaxID=28829 RepID=A0AAV6S4M8_SOLSE|nr:hypothetical protein JOB18_027463 [Solea senegalensis]
MRRVSPLVSYFVQGSVAALMITFPAEHLNNAVIAIHNVTIQLFGCGRLPLPFACRTLKYFVVFLNICYVAFWYSQASVESLLLWCVSNPISLSDQNDRAEANCGGLWTWNCDLNGMLLKGELVAEQSEGPRPHIFHFLSFIILTNQRFQSYDVLHQVYGVVVIL